VAGEDFYALLKIEKDADTAQIKKAFRKMSLEYHPDKNPGKFNNRVSCLVSSLLVVVSNCGFIL